mgnify:CR=1 FL=1
MHEADSVAAWSVATAPLYPRVHGAGALLLLGADETMPLPPHARG